MEYSYVCTFYDPVAIFNCRMHDLWGNEVNNRQTKPSTALVHRLNPVRTVSIYRVLRFFVE